jgi:hypothetical protein
MYGLERDGKLKPEYRGEKGIFQMHRDIGAGFYLQGFFPLQGNFRRRGDKKGKSGNVKTTRYITPRGSLMEVLEYLPGGKTMVS